MKNIKKIMVIGAGQWGTALAFLASKNVEEVLILSRDLEKTQYFNDHHQNTDCFPNILPTNIKWITNFSQSSIKAYILAVPVQQSRSVLKNLKLYITDTTVPIVLCAKGIELEENYFTSELITQMGIINPIIILSGPNFAHEIIDQKKAAATIASHNLNAMDLVYKIFQQETFHVEKIDDVLGLELCSAIKNVYAVAAGIGYGLELGENFHAMMMTNFVKELSLILSDIGADSKTVYSYGGIGDLLLTCSKITSRNMSFGYKIAQGEKIENLIASTTVEGYYTAKSLYTRLLKTNKKYPILTLIYEILYNNAPRHLIKKQIP